MPNHVINVVKFDGDEQDIKKVFAAIDKEGNAEFARMDFNRIIPMPKELDISDGSTTEVAVEEVLRLIGGKKMDDDTFEKRRGWSDMPYQELLELGLQYISNKVHYGHMTWYNWCVEHWGTKWNAYELDFDGEKTITFETAWQAPHPIIEKLAEMFPDVVIDHMWADEDIGYNCGSERYENGKSCGRDYYSHNDASIAFAKELWCWEDDDDDEEEDEE